MTRQKSFKRLVRADGEDRRELHGSAGDAARAGGGGAGARDLRRGGDDGTRVNVVFAAKDDGRSLISVEHARLADSDEAERVKAMWREHLSALKARLEGGDA